MTELIFNNIKTENLSGITTNYKLFFVDDPIAGSKKKKQVKIDDKKIEAFLNRTGTEQQQKDNLKEIKEKLIESLSIEWETNLERIKLWKSFEDNLPEELKIDEKKDKETKIKFSGKIKDLRLVHKGDY